MNRKPRKTTEHQPTHDRDEDATPIQSEAQFPSLLTVPPCTCPHCGRDQQPIVKRKRELHREAVCASCGGWLKVYPSRVEKMKSRGPR